MFACMMAATVLNFSMGGNCFTMPIEVMGEKVNEIQTSENYKFDKTLIKRWAIIDLLRLPTNFCLLLSADYFPKLEWCDFV